MSQPNSIRVDHIGFAVIGYLAYPTFAKMPVYIGAVDPMRLSRQPHHPTQFVER